MGFGEGVPLAVDSLSAWGAGGWSPDLEQRAAAQPSREDGVGLEE